MPTPNVSSSPSKVETCTGFGAAEVVVAAGEVADLVAVVPTPELPTPELTESVVPVMALEAPPTVSEARVVASDTDGVTVTTTTPPELHPAMTVRAVAAAAIPINRTALR
jgi:hypothetical protein